MANPINAPPNAPIGPPTLKQAMPPSDRTSVAVSVAARVSPISDSSAAIASPLLIMPYVATPVPIVAPAAAPAPTALKTGGVCARRFKHGPHNGCGVPIVPNWFDEGRIGPTPGRAGYHGVAGGVCKFGSPPTFPGPSGLRLVSVIVGLAYCAIRPKQFSSHV